MGNLLGEQQKEDNLSCLRLFNTSCQTSLLPESESILVYTALFIVSLMTVLLNMLVLISISHFKQLHTPTNVLIFSLALADLLVGVEMIPFYLIATPHPCWYLGQLTCTLVPYTSCIFLWVSLWNLVLISIDRYIAVCEPLLYSSKITTRRSILFTSLCWVCSFIQNCWFFSDHLGNPHTYNSCTGQCVTILIRYAEMIDLFVTFIIPCIIIIVLYIKIFVVAISQARSIQSTAVCLDFALQKTRKSERKAAKTLSIIITVYFLCIAPYYFFFNFVDVSMALFLIMLAQMNSFLNPLIYAFFYPWFKISTKYIITLKILEPSSSELSLM